jgi:hypothetical protein
VPGAVSVAVTDFVPSGANRYTLRLLPTHPCHRDGDWAFPKADIWRKRLLITVCFGHRTIIQAAIFFRVLSNVLRLKDLF